MADKIMHHVVIGSKTYEIVDEQGRAKVATNTQDITALKEDFSDFKTDVFEERITPSTNLFPSQILTEGSSWNCWTATVYTESNDNYACFEFSIPEGADYISANYAWADNSFSAFVDDNYAKLDLIKNTKQSGSGYIYAIPQGTTKACVSFNRAGSDYTKYLNDGIVYIVGNSNITDKTKDDYAETKEYFADNLKLSSENEATIPEVISALKSTDTKLSGEVAVIAQQFDKKQNLVIGLNEGEYSVAWNIGDTVTTASNASYAYGYADVEECEYVTVNMSSMSDAYSFFTDANHKKVATSVDNQVGSTRVYTVPTGAKYFYISSRDKPVWSVYGMVAFSGDSDIATNPVSAEIYPYNTTLYFADDLKLSTGGTIGSKLENTGMVFHVEKDGSGDFTSFVEAIQEATKYMDSVVYVGAGTWDIIDEFGETYMNAVSSSNSTWGLVLKNRIHLIGTSQTIIKAEYTGSNTNVKTYFAVFNAGEKGFTIENLKIVDDGIRYSVHDDRGWSGSEPYTNRYINCKMIHKNGMYSDCIGAGIGENCYEEIRGCYFEGDNGRSRLVYFHGNNNPNVTNAQAHIIVCDNYFAQDGTFKLTNYGNSTTVSEAYVSNNSFGSAPEVTDGSSPSPIIVNMKLIQWNNEIRTA